MSSVPWCDAPGVERDVTTIRLQLDYPNAENKRTYLDALEALDRLARLAHEATNSQSGTDE